MKNENKNIVFQEHFFVLQKIRNANAIEIRIV